jgi:hypothetical protein
MRVKARISKSHLNRGKEASAQSDAKSMQDTNKFKQLRWVQCNVNLSRWKKSPSTRWKGRVLSVSNASRVLRSYLFVESIVHL